MKEASFFSKVPKRIRKPIYSSVALLALPLASLGANCQENLEGEELSNFTPVASEPTPTFIPIDSSVNSRAFLKMPMPRDEDAKTVQGWKYNALIRGTFNHRGSDFILGSDMHDADTWRTFPVLAAADGVACVGSYVDEIHGKGNFVEILHPNSYRTKYLHNDPESLLWTDFPDCEGVEDTWMPIRQGQKLSEASDYASDEGLVHLHFEVLDPLGNKVDPFDLYTTRDSYPDPSFRNGKLCGKNTLWVNCPTQSSFPTSTPTPPPQSEVICANRMRGEFGEIYPDEPPVGEPAPEPCLRTVDGIPVNIADFRGTVVLLFNYDRQGSGSDRDLEEVVQLKNEYGDRLEVITVAVSESIARHLQERTGPVVVNELEKMAKVYPNGFPSLYLIDEDGILKACHWGVIDDAFMDDIREEVESKDR